MLYHYIVSRSARGDLVRASFTRTRCALTALARRLALRQSVRLVASTHRFGLGQVVADWSAWDSVEQLPKRPHLVEQLPIEFDSNWWNEYVS